VRRAACRGAHDAEERRKNVAMEGGLVADEERGGNLVRRLAEA
jgi:hypothetical protein